MLPLLLIALATLVTEDLTSIATGVLVAQGKIGFIEGTLACLLGIYAGDILLFLAGRALGRPALRWKLFRNFVSPDQVERASKWLSTRGLAVVFLSRFTPGLRLATYFSAGLLRTGFWQFAGYLLLAAAIWTPLLVGLTVVFGEQLLRTAVVQVGGGVAAFASVLVVMAILWKLLRLGFCVRERRMLVGFLKRKARWEFWPPWAAYIPLAPYFAFLALKHRSWTLFTAANPGMPSGGFLGESKSQILHYLSRVDGAVATYALIPATLQDYARVQQANQFLQRNHLALPVVLKPDVGERGTGVAVIHSCGELEAYLHAAEGDTIIQEYVAGVELGVFYYRYPGESKGRIFSITEKRFPELAGDGQSTLAELIARDPRAVCMASVYLARSRRPVDDVPNAGERVCLVELGSHCRGAVFLDGARLKTDSLAESIERISRSHPGFFFGRFDIRAPSLQAFQDGRFKVIELNGVSAEATHIYDPAVSFLDAYRVMFAQWRIAFEIGAMNRERGVAPLPLPALLSLLWTRARRRRRAQDQPMPRPLQELG